MHERSQTAALRDSETTEELIGVLTAISVVTKRMATKLVILKQRSARRGGEKPDAKRTPMPIKATPYRHQREAFAFACRLFGLAKGGDANADQVRTVREGDTPQAQRAEKASP